MITCLNCKNSGVHTEMLRIGGSTADGGETLSSTQLAGYLKAVQKECNDVMELLKIQSDTMEMQTKRMVKTLEITNYLLQEELEE